MDECPQLVVGGKAVEVDERAREVVGLDDHIVVRLVGFGLGDPSDHACHDGRECLDEPRDRRLQAEVDPHEVGA
jgi:hypothetical protein